MIPSLIIKALFLLLKQMMDNDDKLGGREGRTYRAMGNGWDAITTTTKTPKNSLH